MGRLPATFEGRRIMQRVPWNAAGTLNVVAGAVGQEFAERLFDHNIEKPFEIHRAIIRLTALDANQVVALVQPAAGLLERLVRIRIFDWAKQELITKNSSFVSVVIKGTTAGSEQCWEWVDPYYLSRGEGFQVRVDNFTTAPTAPFTRVEINFQGFKIVVAPPSGER